MNKIKRILNNWPLLFLAAAVLFNLVMLFPETAIKSDLNDSVFAMTLITRLNKVLSQITASGLSFSRLPLLIDNWVPEFNMGFPVFSYYQHLPHLAVVILYRIISLWTNNYSLLSVFNWLKYIMLAFFPLVIYLSAKKFGFSKIGAATSALISTLISTQYLYGTDYNSLVFRGSGMFTQLTGMFFLPLAVSCVYDSVVNSRGYVKAVIFLSLSFAGHLIFGYMAVLSTPLILLVAAFNPAGRNLTPRGNFSINNFTRYFKRLFLILTSCFLLLSYWFIPLFLNSAYQNKSLWDDYTKFNSFGVIQIIKWLVNGQLFDNNRFPVLTIMIAMGFFYALYKYFGGCRATGLPVERLQSEQSEDEAVGRGRNTTGPAAIFFPLLFLFWLVLYFGRYSLGPLFDLLPMSEGIHGHRFINGVHLAGIFLCGLGFEWIFNTVGAKLKLFYKKVNLNPATKQFNIIHCSLFILIIILILYPAVRERYDYLDYNTYSIKYNTDLYDKDSADFQKTMDKIKSEGVARINIGRPGNWGRNFGPGPFSAYFGTSINNIPTVGFAPESWSPNTDIDQFFSEFDPAYYNVFNIRYVVAPVSEKFDSLAAKYMEKIGNNGKFYLYKVDTGGLTQNRLGNFEFINTDTLIYTNKNYRFNLDRLWLGSKLMPKQNHPIITYNRNFDATGFKNVFTMTDLSGYHTGQPWQRNEPLNIFGLNPFDTDSKIFQYNLDPAPGKIISEKNSDNYYFAKVQTPKDAVLMLKVSYHPFWTATIDGKKADKFSVIPLFMAVKVPAGSHVVEFSYFPAWYKNVLIFVSLLTLPVLYIFLKKKLLKYF